MKKVKMTLAAAGLIFFLAIHTTASLQKVEIEGVAFDLTLTALGTPMELQGYGLLRYMWFIKAYVGALYLPPAVPPDAVLEPVAKRLELQYFHAIGKEDFGRATRIKIADNVSSAQFEELRPRIDQLADLYRDVRPGDRYSLTFIPGVGTELALNDKPLGSIPGSDFAQALFAVWLGNNPIDDDFRVMLLGGR